MDQIRRPASLRGMPRTGAFETRDKRAAGAATLGCLIAAGTATTAEAQGAGGLPPVTVDAPVARPRPAASRPSAAQVRARDALRRRNQAQRQATPAVPNPTSGGGGLPIFAQAPDANPYADPAAPYKADRLSSNKFTEPLANQPRTVTVLTKEFLEDRNLTSVREVARTTNGITLGTGEGGNAFGDRFFIRGFDARNDVFVDGIRDAGISVRENFFTEQIEILRGPGSTFAGRGVAGGAINIVTKQAGDKDFYKGEVQGGVENGLQRVTLDINKVVTPDFSFRVNGMEQTGGVSGRNYVTDDRWGIGGAVKINPTDNMKITANFFHTDLDSIPDFGVPLYRGTVGARTIGNLRPSPETFGNRDTFYGFVNRDFFRVQQDIGTIRTELTLNDNVALTNTFRAGHSVLDYVGTLPQGPNYSNANPALWTVTASPQSRYQTSDIVANQTDLTVKFDTGPVRHTVVAGIEIDRETFRRESYNGLQSELFGNFTSNGATTQSFFFPNNLVLFPTKPVRSGIRTTIPVDTNSAYVIETANWNDFIILNGGVRYDHYDVTARTLGVGVSETSGLVNYNAGIVVKPIPIASVYAAVATSSNPVGAEVDASGSDYGGLSATSTANQALPPEQNTAYEVGTKWELFDRHLLATAAFFHTTKDKARETNGNTILSSGRYTVEGIDLGVQGKITDWWSVFGGYTNFSANVDRSFNPANVGLRLANLASESFSLSNKFKVNSWLEIGQSSIYVSKILGGTFAANANEIPAHWRFDAFAEARVNRNFKLTLNVQNILDKTYYDAFYRSNVPFVFVAPGRTVTLIASAKF